LYALGSKMHALSPPIASGKLATGCTRKVLQKRSGKSVENCPPKRHASLKEQEGPQVPVHALSTINMHVPNSIDAARVPHR